MQVALGCCWDDGSRWYLKSLIRFLVGMYDGSFSWRAQLDVAPVSKTPEGRLPLSVSLFICSSSVMSGDQ